MPRMFTPTVIEARLALEPVAADPFVADLTAPSLEAAALLASVAASPRRRIYD
jgi:hypothetical protein